MFHPIETLPTAVQGFRATGTILAGDVKKLFHEVPLNADSRAMIEIDAEFDGYLSELSKGLRKEAAHLPGVKIALVLPEGMVKEAELSGLSESGEPVRVFATTDQASALDWLSAS